MSGKTRATTSSLGFRLLALRYRTLPNCQVAIGSIVVFIDVLLHLIEPGWVITGRVLTFLLRSSQQKRSFENPRRQQNPRSQLLTGDTPSLASWR